MPNTHVPIERRFAPPVEKQLKDPDYVSLLGSQSGSELRWAELRECRCVVVLGEGKCGKTHEFRQQHQRLRAEGGFSFFVPLELLQDCDFCDAITEVEEQEFEQWLSETDKEAVFFLDAVDELKLRKGTLRKALRKIKSATGPQTHRARFFVSCRPNDWNQELDRAAVAGLIPRKERMPETTDCPDGEKVFSAVVTREKFVEPRQELGKGDDDEEVKVVALLPLSRDETVEFANRYASDHAKALEKHLEEKELWHLYQLPADITSALDQLICEGRLGNLQEQLAFGIGHKLREVSNKKRNALNENRAMEGAQRIALALMLMKRKSIYFESPGGDSEGVGVADILTDWSLDEQQELLGKPLFDPTGVGAVRFHHRSTQEFLAAQRMKSLRASGLATADLFNLLFADVGDEEVIVPSMEPLAAWMALWNSDILTEVKKRNPLLLFRQGIPALLSIEQRGELLRRFVERFYGREWCGIGVGHQELKRVAMPELSPVVRELWEQAYTGHDTRELLLEFIYLTPMSDCADLAFQAAYDESLPSIHRSYAVWGVLRCGTCEQKRSIGLSMVAGEWPERVVRNVLPELLPDAITVAEFLTLARSLKEVPRSVHGLGYALLKSVLSDAVSNEQKVLIRDDFSQAIWEYRTAESRVYQAHSQYDHFVDAVIAACYATVPTASEDVSNWAWCLAVAFQFGERQSTILAKDEAEKLRRLLSSEASLREAYFWASLNITTTLEPPENDRQKSYRIDHHRTLTPFTQADFPWLLHALRAGGIEERRGVAFYTLTAFVRDRENLELAKQISELVSDRADLSDELEIILNPPPCEPDKYEIEYLVWRKEREAEEAQRIDGWKQWREAVLAGEDFLLSNEDRENTLYNLHHAVQRSEADNGSWGHWNSSFVESAFSPEFFERVRKELSRYWRETDVLLYSERPEDSRNSYPQSSLMALAAVKCNAEEPGWAKMLVHDEAVRAVRISTIELNGFASFLPQIEADHPQAVEEVIVGEVQAQVGDFLDIGAAPIFHDLLYHGTPEMQRSAVRAIFASWSAFPAVMSEGNHNDLQYAFELIAAQGSDAAVRGAVDVIETLLNGVNQLTVEARNFWSQILAQLDPERACDYVLASTKDLSTEETLADAISLFAAVFGERHVSNQLALDGLEPAKLKALVIRAYQAIQPKDDLKHEGTYTPKTRDHAEGARSYLLQCLAKTSSLRALNALHELSSLPEFNHFSDRLKQMATELAAQISEPEAMNASTFSTFDQEKNYLPYDDPSLFAVMNNRLADFEHHLVNDEQSTVDTLRKVDEETQLRRFISSWLNQNSRGAYTITQEAVVVGEKRTDIRLHASGLDRYASIELKLDDKRNKWSGTQLRKALVDQLVGRYLNHERCQVGCLLICMREERRWQHPETGEYMDLETTVGWLQGIADEIMTNRPGLFISVKGIDYSSIANE